MIKDNMVFTQAERPLNRTEIIGTYGVEASLFISDMELDSGGLQMREEVKEILTDQCRKVITADVLDVPFLKLLYKNDAMKQLVIDALDIRAFDLRNRIVPKSDGKEYEDVKMLDELIYKLRILLDE